MNLDINHSKFIGIMQGRLSRRIGDKIQSFPINDWEKEFQLAAEIGYSCIEWVIDSNEVENPIFSNEKRKVIHSLMENYNISIPAICHDQLMDMPLHSKNQNSSRLAIKILRKTIDACENLGVKFIEIPLVGNGSLLDEEDNQKLIDQLARLDNQAKDSGISFILETDLTPELNASLMEKMKDLSVGLNFDMGNSAYWGFDPDIELQCIGPYIKNVHIKDCKPDIYTVPLGSGNVDFEKVLKHLKSQGYNGLFILQAAPASLGSEFEIAKQYYQFTIKKLQEYFF